MLYYKKPINEIFKELDSSEKGLSASEAKEHLQKYGPNLINVKGTPLWKKIIEPFKSLFMLVLFVAIGISILHKDYTDAIIIGAIILLNVTIYYVQQATTEKVLQSLKGQDKQLASVLRDQIIETIETHLIVPGDVIVLNEGDKVPADCRIFYANSLRVDESQLTGESEPISKQPLTIKTDKEIYEQNNMLFQGSFIVSGTSHAIVIATGNNTEFGQLALLTNKTFDESPVQQKIDKLISQIIVAVISIATIAFALSIYRGMDLAESLKFVIALSVSAIPESLPIAITVVLVLGMRRMAAKKALVKTMRSIESIGVITTIATDKTGTLTKNKLTVGETWIFNPRKHKEFNKTVHLATQPSSHDPLDTAFIEYTNKEEIKKSSQKPLSVIPFDQSVSMSGNLWHNGNKFLLAIKGAPEHVLTYSDLTEGEREKASLILHELTAKGYRVIAIAYQNLEEKITNFKDLSKKDIYTFVGYIAVSDILRPEAKRSIQKAQAAGIAVRMITGDHFETAFHIGKQLGIVQNRSQVFDSRKISVFNDDDLSKIIDNTRIFSRVTPEHKYRILDLLKVKNITAMTGDGVNDVPALTNAHVGIAMGSGSQIAKDASDIILLDNNFKSIVDAMQEGRIIFDNIRKMLFYLLSTNTGEVLTMLGSLFIGLPIPLAPVQILWVNLVTDSAMVIPLGLEPGEKGIIKQKPKETNSPILNKILLSRMVVVAITMAVLTISIYYFYYKLYGHVYGQTIAFSALVSMQWANAFNARSSTESIFKSIKTMNIKFYIGLTIAIAIQLAALFGPLGNFLHISKDVYFCDLVIVTIITFVIPILLVEIHKTICRKYFISE